MRDTAVGRSVGGPDGSTVPRFHRYVRPVAYDALKESVRLIKHGMPDDPARLSRRRRFAALAVDVDGDVAAALFVRRGVGVSWQEVHVLAHEHGCWRLLGGGGGTDDEDGLGDRPPAAELLGLLVTDGAGSVLLASGLLPWSSRYVHHAVLRAAREVHTVVVAGRTLAVRRHGWLVVVWGSRRPPVVTALGLDGREVASIRLGASHRPMPEWYRA